MASVTHPHSAAICSGSEVSILGIRTHASRFDSAIRMFAAWAAEKQARRVSFCPVYTIMRAYDDPGLREVINSADFAAADGMPVVWTQRRRGAPTAERVYGPDVMLALCEATTRTDGSGLRHFLLGGGDGVAAALAARLRERFPGINIVGTYAPDVSANESSGRGVPRPYNAAIFSPSPAVRERGSGGEGLTLPTTSAAFSLLPACVGEGSGVRGTDSTALALIHAAAPDILWVALGSPKQDRWMAANQPYLDCLMLGVGAAFDFLSGHKPQAPRWMQRSGLEWTFRLASEPGRLWRRYVVESPRFLWHVFREQLDS